MEEIINTINQGAADLVELLETYRKSPEAIRELIELSHGR